MTFAELTFYLFTGFNALRLVSYVPQIWRVARDTNGASAISYWTWSLWIAANASTGLYAFTNLGDLVLTATNAINALCCATVIVLTAYKRRHIDPSRGAIKAAEFSH
jgi:predicted MFS family arabinose efflux permease